MIDKTLLIRGNIEECIWKIIEKIDDLWLCDYGRFKNDGYRQ